MEDQAKGHADNLTNLIKCDDLPGSKEEQSSRQQIGGHGAKPSVWKPDKPEFGKQLKRLFSMSQFADLSFMAKKRGRKGSSGGPRHKEEAAIEKTLASVAAYLAREKARMRN
jgi:hypothetical protein